MANKGVVNTGYQYSTGGIQKRQQTDAYTLNKGEKLHTIFNNLLDVDGSAEYLEVDVAGVITGYILKEEYLKDYDRLIAGVPIVLTAANKLTYFLVSRTISIGAGGTELDPVYTAEKGQPNGTATLNTVGTVPTTQLEVSAVDAATGTIAVTDKTGTDYAVANWGYQADGTPILTDRFYFAETAANRNKTVLFANLMTAIQSNLTITPAQLPQTAFANLLAFPLTGVEGLVYIAKDTDLAYLWDPTTSTYKPLGSATTSTITTTPTTVTGVATPAQKIAFGIGINGNVATGEVWFKDPVTSTVTKIQDVTSPSYNQDIALGYAIGAANAGTSFDSNINGGIMVVSLPAGVTSAKVDPTSIVNKIFSGGTPASPTIVKVQKNGSVDMITYVIDPNSTTGGTFGVTNNMAVTLANGDIITCNLSQAVLGADFGIYFTLIKA